MLLYLYFIFSTFVLFLLYLDETNSTLYHHFPFFKTKKSFILFLFGSTFLFYSYFMHPTLELFYATFAVPFLYITHLVENNKYWNKFDHFVFLLANFLLKYSFFVIVWVNLFISILGFTPSFFMSIYQNDDLMYCGPKVMIKTKEILNNPKPNVIEQHKELNKVLPFELKELSEIAFKFYPPALWENKIYSNVLDLQILNYAKQQDTFLHNKITVPAELARNAGLTDNQMEILLSKSVNQASEHALETIMPVKDIIKLLDPNYSMQTTEYLRNASIENNPNFEHLVGLKYALLTLPHANEHLSSIDILNKTVLQDKIIYKSVFNDKQHLFNLEPKYGKLVLTDGNIAETRFLSKTAMLFHEVFERVQGEKQGDYDTYWGNAEVKLGKFTPLENKAYEERFTSSNSDAVKMIDLQWKGQVKKFIKSDDFTLSVDITEYNYWLNYYQTYDKEQLIEHLLEQFPQHLENKRVIFFDKSSVFITFNGKIIEKLK